MLRRSTNRGVTWILWNCFLTVCFNFVFAEDSIFRRITPQQLRKSKYRPVDGLKVHGALLSLSLCEEPAGFDVEQFDVSLTYMDRDGDKVLIHTRDDLIAAMDEYAELKKLKVFADVKRSPKPPSRAPPRAEAPSVDSATQTPRAAKNRRSAPVPVQEVVESLVGLLADATTTAANAVHSHLNEHSAVAPRASARAPPQEKPQSAVAKQDLAPSKPSGDDSVPKDSPSSTSKPSAEDSAPKEASTANGPNATEETSKPFIHGRHTCDSCLTTPIIGKRFHAINMPDFDLCASCMESYTGKDTKFEVVELGTLRCASLFLVQPIFVSSHIF